jgi:hypothetical protein
MLPFAGTVDGMEDSREEQFVSKNLEGPYTRDTGLLGWLLLALCILVVIAACLAIWHPWA